MESTPPSTSADRPLRVLVVDDSAYNRQTIAAMLAEDPCVEVIGRAVNGKEALQMAFELRPDVITLDLEMPEMDGYAFLRLLMAKSPVPVLVVSSHDDRESVFRALELGAMDFIAKPRRQIGPELGKIANELRAKIAMVSRLQVVPLQMRAHREEAGTMATQPAEVRATHSEVLAVGREQPLGLLGVAASTGGPPAIQQLLRELPSGLPLAIVIAQHMPARFTRAFAGRLDRMSLFHVREAVDGELLERGVVYLAPGARDVEILGDPGGAGRIRVRDAQRGGTLMPSGDLLFRSGVQAYGSRFCALVLTGMGSDGTEGATAAHAGGATVLAEDPETAVMPGMPSSAIAAGVVDQVLRLGEMPVAIARFAERCRSGSDDAL
ncbi:MAG TPA: chemotaxis-specific protein-glutamate methyltransferase CheB [Nannocystis exedens]|nr:chemotaxis-specific protein-glutamate methyltransferase CheB [Nannocystis exedens]